MYLAAASVRHVARLRPASPCLDTSHAKLAVARSADANGTKRSADVFRLWLDSPSLMDCCMYALEPLLHASNPDAVPNRELLYRCAPPSLQYRLEMPLARSSAS